MDLWEITRNGVKRAIEEHDRLGRVVFLDNYGYGPAKKYHLVYGGRRYDSKAIVGVAYGYDCPELGPLDHVEFHGGVGIDGAATCLLALGFEVWNSETRSYL